MPDDYDDYEPPDDEEWEDPDVWLLDCPYCEGEGCDKCDWTGEH